MSRRGAQKNKNEERDVPSCIYVIGGRGVEGEALSTVEFYDSRSGVVQEWIPEPDLPEARWAASACGWGGKIWVFGGNNGGPSLLNTAAVFDPHTEEWTPIPHMSYRRANACASAVGKKIYVCGGFGGERGKDTPLDSVERYDPAENKWEVAPKMSAKRFNMGAAVIGPLLFIIGGASDKVEPLKSMERFDARQDTAPWESMAPMREKRQGCAAAAIQGMPFVCGGHDGTSVLDTVEFFQQTGKPWLEGGKDGSWQASPRMSVPRYGCMACTALHADKKAKMYVFGGHTGMERVGTVECIAWDGQQWELIPKQATAEGKRMDPRSGAAIACLEAAAVPRMQHGGAPKNFLDPEVSLMSTNPSRPGGG